MSPAALDPRAAPVTALRGWRGRALGGVNQAATYASVAPRGLSRFTLPNTHVLSCCMKCAQRLRCLKKAAERIVTLPYAA